ncbi:CYFA0S14e00562g1_1 [Cyberlindnera fabianii]|uniref:Methylthioribose-1-phosphate isomerase n=1 Tax=Cyberlindnera fabianii TaxID=36022 RepID=A0A061B2Z1_CYBFA|nr:CYFA0S14e00562g1_1 [Cyberlindnera fabianii]
MSTLQAIKFDREALTLSTLDQLVLPYATKYIPIYTIADAFQVIKLMQVRGAPAIAIVGALSVIIELSPYLKGKNAGQAYYDLQNFTNFKSQLIQRLDYLVTSRPTAVNLGNAVTEIKQIVNNTKATTIDELFPEIFKFGCDLIDDDYINNTKLGENGKDWILKSLAAEGFEGEFGILTICNTGSLATSGYGTALGVIRSLWSHAKENGSTASSSSDEPPTKKAKSESKIIKMSRAYPLETRPYNQGARLTAYELVYENIPSTLITDSMVTYLVSSLSKNSSAAPIKACVVGADRIVSNGDTANKIGTYQLALICKQFGIKFLVVAPKTTIDMKTAHGDEIVVEQRPANELQNVSGGVVDPATNKVIINENGVAITGKVGVAAPGIEVWNPSFDVTPHELIDGIVTEDGVMEKVNGEFNLAPLFQ